MGQEGKRRGEKWGGRERETEVRGTVGLRGERRGGREEAEGGKEEGREGGKGGERERFVQKVTSKIEETKLGNLLKSG